MLKDFLADILELLVRSLPSFPNDLDNMKSVARLEDSRYGSFPQGERDALQRAARPRRQSAPLTEPTPPLTAQQGAIVEMQQAVAAEVDAGNNILFAWVGPDSYRELHRAYGALISDQQIVQDRYAEVLRDLQQAVGAAPAPTVQEEGRYQIAPHFYNRIEYALSQGTVADILAQAGSADDVAAPAETQE